MGLDLDAILDMPLGYSQSNGTIPLRESLAALYPGATPDHIEVTNGTSEANYLLALALLRRGDEVAFQVPNYMQYWGLPKSLGARVNPSACASTGLGARLGRVRARRQRRAPAWSTSRIPTTPPAPCSRRRPCGASWTAARRWAPTCSPTKSTWAPRSTASARRSFWGMSDRVIVTSGLSKAYGIPGVRIGWIVGPKPLIAECWTQHDYITIGPNKISDAVARVAVQRENREKLYARTRAILQQNLPICASGWRASAASSPSASRKPARCA